MNCYNSNSFLFILFCCVNIFTSWLNKFYYFLGLKNFICETFMLPHHSTKNYLSCLCCNKKEQLNFNWNYSALRLFIKHYDIFAQQYSMIFHILWTKLIQKLLLENHDFMFQGFPLFVLNIIAISFNWTLAEN